MLPLAKYALQNKHGKVSTLVLAGSPIVADAGKVTIKDIVYPLGELSLESFTT